MKLTLPPLDIYRSPFVEPIGHLAMQAAKADLAIINLCAAAPYDGSALQMHPEEVGPQLRNWDEKTRQFILARLELITDIALKEQATIAATSFGRLRDFRHRVIHDAVELGMDMDGLTFPIAVAFRKVTKERSDLRFHRVTPEEIAALAYEFYELNLDLDFIISRVHDSTPGK